MHLSYAKLYVPGHYTLRAGSEPSEQAQQRDGQGDATRSGKQWEKELLRDVSPAPFYLITRRQFPLQILLSTSTSAEDPSNRNTRCLHQTQSTGHTGVNGHRYKRAATLFSDPYLVSRTHRPYDGAYSGLRTSPQQSQQLHTRRVGPPFSCHSFGISSVVLATHSPMRLGLSKVLDDVVVLRTAEH